MRKIVLLAAIAYASMINFSAPAHAEKMTLKQIGFFAPEVGTNSLSDPDIPNPERGALVLQNNAGSESFKGYNGSGWVPLSAGSAPTAPKVTTYLTGSGVHTFTGSPLYVRVRMIGGGGGGGGGAQPPTGTAGSSGTSSTFGGSLIVASPGGGGGSANAGVGSGGPASLGAGVSGLALHGADGAGGQGTGNPNAIYVSGGAGASTPFGGGGAGRSANPGGTAPANTGAGGGGGGTDSTAGAGSGAGGGAGGYVDAVISGTTLSGLGGSALYQVGTSGIHGNAGTNGFIGGDGAAGMIEITEYYQ